MVAAVIALLLAAPVAVGAQDRAAQGRERAERALERVERLAERRGVTTGRELTLALVDLARQRGALSRSDQARADRFFARPTDAADADAYEAPSFKSCTDHFCVHWVETGNAAPDLTDGPDACVTPDYIDAMQTAFERSYAVENTALGWRAPVPDGTRGGDSRTDVYVTDLNLPGDDTSLYGYANVDVPSSARSLAGYLVMDDDYAADEFEDYDGDPLPPMQVTAAHEYNHVLQFGYDFQQDLWMFESTATWAEEKVFPAIDDYLFYLPTFASLPEQPITTAANGRQYGSAVWNHYLESRYGPEVIREAWARSAFVANSVNGLGFAPKAYDAAIKARGGSSFEDAFGDFTAATADWTAANSGFPDAGRYPVVDRVNLAYDTVAPIVDLDHTSYRLFQLPDSGAARLDLAATLPVNVAGSVALVGDDAGQMTRVVAPAPTGGTATVSLSNPGRFESITAVVTNADRQHEGFNGSDWDWTGDDGTATVEVTQESSAARLTSDTTADEVTPAVRAAAAIPAESTVKACNPDGGGITPQPTASPTATPTVTPTPTPKPATSVRLTRNTTRIASAARKGVLSLFARTNKAGRLTARATVDTVTAKRLKVGRRTTTAGRGRRTATAPARVKINVKLTRRVRAALRRQTKRTLRIKVRVTFVPADGTRAVRRTLSVLLRP